MFSIRRAAGATACLIIFPLSLAPGVRAQQTMQDALNRLFVFGEGSEALFLVGSAQVPATEVHGDHFIPASTDANGAMLEFFGRTIAKNVSSFPIPTTVGSETYVFVDGVPTRTSNSFGPIVAERAQTLGRGRLSAGLTYSRLSFTELRGVDMRDLRFNFVHENVDFPNCDAIFGGDCTEWGTPQFENDIIELALDLDVQADVWTMFASYGLTDWLDISVAVPVVTLEMFGESRASVAVSTGDDPTHFFGGSPESPVLSASTSVRETATGIGDVAARMKARLGGGDTWQFGVLSEVRLPTGRSEDFLGSGEWNGRAQLVFSGTLGDFAPHGSFGYEYRGSEFDENEFRSNLGFDQRVADWATLAIDVLGTFKTGDRALTLPRPVEIETPFRRVVQLTNIPERRDDLIDGAIGFKIRARPGLFILTNALVPLNDGGLRAGVVPTVGIEFTH